MHDEELRGHSSLVTDYLNEKSKTKIRERGRLQMFVIYQHMHK